MSLPPSFEAGGRAIGPGEPSYLIAEAGSNHNRDLDVAKQLIDVSAHAGADAVKFQTYSGDRLYSRRAQSKYLGQYGADSPAELLERIALPREWHAVLAEHARERGIHFFSSPFDHEAVDELAEVGVPLLKIASGEIVDLPLIRKAAATGIPLIVSTGMATLEEVGEAVTAAEEAGATALALMQCASVYPAAPGLINLRAMDTLRDEFGVPAGLSDHTTGIAVPAAAAARGAAMIEKHITLDRSMEGPDHSFAIEPGKLVAMVKAVRDAEAALGDGLKEGPNAAERDENYVLARRSLIAARDLAAGTVIEPDMLTVKRPGSGIAPKHFDDVVGRTLAADVEADDVLTWEVFQE